MSELSNNLINGQTRSKYIVVTHRESQNRLLIIKQCFLPPFHLEIKLEIVLILSNKLYMTIDIYEASLKYFSFFHSYLFKFYDFFSDKRKF